MDGKSWVVVGSGSGGYDDAKSVTERLKKGDCQGETVNGIGRLRKM